MAVPRFKAGYRDYYEAHITENGAGDCVREVYSLAIDEVPFNRRVSLVKIDAEGHDLPVVRGMVELLKRCNSTVIVEGNRAGSLLESLGYQGEHSPGSSNYVYRYKTSEAGVSKRGGMSV